jgi:hypothetical protein
MALTGCDSLPERARTRGDPAVSETVMPNSVSGAAVGQTHTEEAVGMTCSSRRRQHVVVGMTHEERGGSY